jgi:formylglycine-generating enzyme required for sulfatase activity
MRLGRTHHSMTERSLHDDPVLAMLPEIRGRRVLPPCVLYARLGRGGMGAVYLGKHLTLRQRQVVKCLWLMGGGTPTDDGFVERFQQEARIAAEMTHQNLVRVTHVDRLGDLHYLVMEYIDGEDVDRRVRRSGRLDEAAAVALLHGAAQGLGYAHGRGIVHRDVKPANLMISSRGEVKVIDLGLARAMDTQRQLGVTMGPIGTPLYMAPEQWDHGSVGPTADIWALGATLYYVLVGKPHLPADLVESSAIRRFVCEQPFPDPRDAGVKVGKDVRRILARCTANDPAERYPDARALLADLAPLVEGRECVLAESSRAPTIVADEPEDAELAALQEELQRRAESGRPLTGARRQGTEGRPDATLPFVRGGTPGRQASPVATADGGATVPTASPSPSSPPPPSPPPRASRRRARPWPMVAALAAASLVVISAGVMSWPRLDPAAVQQAAMAAIYQERFLDADRLLQQLESVAAFADQARRLRIDALVKAAVRGTHETPLQAWSWLDRAAALAPQLLIQRDIDDARTRIAAVHTPLIARVQEWLAARCRVLSPAVGERLVRGEQVVRVEVTDRSLQLQLQLEANTLQADREPGVFTGTWVVPAAPGPHEVQIVVTEATTQVQHVLRVPIVAERGAVALRLAPMLELQPSNGSPVLVLRGAVDHGPVDVQCTLLRPDGSRERFPLGPRDGEFRCEVPVAMGVDGEYAVQLTTTTGDEVPPSPECRVRVDRAAPQLELAPLPRHTASPTLWVRGRASEPCRVAWRDHPGSNVETDADGGFALPLPLPTEDGDISFVLTAQDAAGNVRNDAATLAVRIDRTSPRLVEPALVVAERTAAEQIVVQGALDEPGEVGSEDGAVVATAADGSFSLSVVLPPGAIEQWVTLRLFGSDAAGNRAPLRTLSVFVDRRGPTLGPAAPDGTWLGEGRWQLLVEDPSGPLQVTVGGETQPLASSGRIEFARRSSDRVATVVVRDALGNSTEGRATVAGGRGGEANLPTPGPTWGTPVPGTAVDPVWHLHERVVVPVGDQSLVLRLVRPLRDEELPPVRERDPRAIALLQGQSPFYLAETEVTAAAWAEFVRLAAAPDQTVTPRVFDPDRGQWAVQPTASWREPLHPKLRGEATAAERARWPVTQVTPEAARAFCQQFQLRLPHEHEWWFVVRLGGRGRYGHGGAAIELRANLADLSLQAKAPTLAAFEPVDDGCAGLAAVDAFPRAAERHPWGFHGLLGNAAEWCTTARDRVVARGGSFASPAHELRVDTLRPDGLVTGGAWDCVGFRVARDP